MEHEAKLIKQIKKTGNKAAANELVSRHYYEIYRYVYKQTREQEQSLDLTQEIFIKMLQGIYQFDRKKAAFRTWLYKIATYTIVDYFRSKVYRMQKATVAIHELELAQTDDVTLTILYNERVDAVMNEVNSLESSLQQILRLKLFAEYTFKEVSLALHITESSVKTKYYRGLAIIKHALKEVASNE
ncbi:RNA polymerase sigma-70 factor, ECF subfamily [Amphibacillus marinus]|uniref:RNA polymerase sigma-70 factor, ECF subfamily n=1 Tax=Amphibacillus marinus TaxID=872970 RepID=A0A1H8PPA8_9BACI|nr:RNA polymerase sigma factor [Amphibacillus marinus]SEO43363.1 RNA polymerase sigma-70 factor, ECF subfamily [Amphibacillus marinus]